MDKDTKLTLTLWGLGALGYLVVLRRRRELRRAKPGGTAILRGL